MSNKKPLESRENGKMKGEGWYGYVYPKNLDLIGKANAFIAKASSALWGGIGQTGCLYHPVTERSSPPQMILISTKIKCGHGNIRPARGRAEGLENRASEQWSNKRILAEMRSRSRGSCMLQMPARSCILSTRNEEREDVQ